MAYLISKINPVFEKPRANTPDYDPAEWFLVSDLTHAPTKWPDYTILTTAVLNIKPKYRKVKNDNIVVMTAAGKAIVDKAEADIAKETEKESIIQSKINELTRANAIDVLKSEGVLNGNGDLI